MKFGRAFVDVLREIEETHEEEIKKNIVARNIDPWFAPLSRVKGKIDFVDNLERVSSQTLLDLLEVPQQSRRARFSTNCKTDGPAWLDRSAGAGPDRTRFKRASSRLLPTTDPR